MSERYMKSNNKEEFYTANIDVFIERLRKVRALNSDPSRVGMDSYILKKLPFNKVSILTKYF
jgi:hypothetical protein